MKRSLKFFSTQEEAEKMEQIRFFSLSPLERLQEMRQCINLAYGMHGYSDAILSLQLRIRINKLHHGKS